MAGCRVMPRRASPLSQAEAKPRSPVLLRNRRRYHLLQSRVLAQPAEFLIFVDVRQVAIAVFLRPLQALQTAVEVSALGVRLRQQIGVLRALLGTRDLRRDARSGVVPEGIGIKFHGASVF